jgi:exopolysaccharide biosynthesis polyprenyl glycosylphosphotransferase
VATVTAAAGSATQHRVTTRRRMARALAFVGVLDVLLLTAAVPLALWLQFGAVMWHEPTIIPLTGVPVVDFGWVVPFWFADLVLADALSRRTFARGAEEYRAVLRGSIAAALVGAMLCYLVNYDLSRGFYFFYFLVATSLLLAERYVVGRVVARSRRSGELLHRAVLVGSAEEALAVHRVLARKPELGYEVAGVCLSGDGHPGDLDVVGRPEDAVWACQALAADTLVVASGGTGSSDQLRRIGWELADSDVDLVVVPGLLDVAGTRIHARPLSGLPFLHVEPPQADRAMKWRKAAFDRIGALALLVLLSPLLVAVAVAVLVDGGRPVLFRHERVGAGGRSFGLWKFRSMVCDATARHAELVAENGANPLLFKVKGDPRVTRVGGFLRRWSLDELPQLVNVLMGQMSLVGPRPQVTAEVEQYVDADHRRLMVRPGLTGLWQVSGRSDLSWEESIRLDLSYVDNWSMTGDLVILFRTIRAVLRRDGAY